MPIAELDVDALARLLGAAARVALLDVRSESERIDGTFDGDISIPLDELAARVDELAESVSRDAHVIAYCAHGIRSRAAVAILQSAGFSRVESLRGGFAAWQSRRRDTL